MTVPLARRQLLARPARTFAGLAGIAVALLLVLALEAIFAGMEQRLTAYISRSGADVIVAQRGVDTMHMTESALPAGAVGEIGRIPGAMQARGILYVSTLVERDGKRGVAYLVGEQGRREPGPGEIVLDGSFGAPVGSTVSALGRRFRVAGEIEGTASIASFVAYAGFADLARALRSPGIVSYVLVRARPGVDAGTLAARIEREVPQVTASTRERFLRSERRVVGDMATDVVRGMILIGFVIGVAVAGLVAYGATLSQLRDFAVLRALGLPARRALGLVLAQVAATVAAALALALLLVWLLGLLLPRLSPSLAVVVSLPDVVRTAFVASAVAAVAAAFPVIRVARIDPASVFRR